MDVEDEHGPAASRLDAFRTLAQARARGEMVVLPRMLEGADRRVHVRQTLREDHRGDLSKDEWCDYAAICGGVLAQAHALSDETGHVDHDVEPEILRSMGSRELFVEDVLAFADEACDRVRTDHECFKRDHARGAFRDIDVVFR